MKSKGITKCIYFPMAVNEEKFKIVDLTGEETRRYACDFCFVGGPTDQRMQMLESIHDKDLKIYGYHEDRWCSRPLLAKRFQHPVFARDELVKIYNASLSSVNITRAHGKSSLNMRVFEAMACGSLLLTDDKQDARELFDPEQEILIYKDQKGLRKKAGWITCNREGARRIGRQGRDRVLGEHTYCNRLLKVFPLIEQFVQEFGDFKYIVENITSHRFIEAEARMSELEREGNQILNREWLALLWFHVLMSKGRVWAARQHLDKSLEINPHFIHSLRSKAGLD